MPYQSRSAAAGELHKTFDPIVAWLRGGRRVAVPAVALKVLRLILKQQKTRTTTMTIAMRKRIASWRHKGPVVKAVMLAEATYSTGATV